jgi:hypothetical protein
MSALPEKNDGIRLTEEEKARRARRSKAIGLAIAGLCLLFYVISVFKMGAGVVKRPL